MSREPNEEKLKRLKDIKRKTHKELDDSHMLHKIKLGLDYKLHLEISSDETLCIPHFKTLKELGFRPSRFGDRVYQFKHTELSEEGSE